MFEEKYLKEKGFGSMVELLSMVGGLDLSSPGKMQAFELWKKYDGSKKGLESLPVEEQMNGL